MTGAWTILWREREQASERAVELSFVKVSKEGKKQSEVMAKSDVASSHFDCFLQLQLPFVWDAGMRLSLAWHLCISLLQ